MPSLPSEVGDAEKIVRAIKTPFHIKKGKLKLNAFRPRPTFSVVSVIRQLVGDDNCKDKAIEICGEAYLGLAVIQAGEIREIGSEVVDFPEDYIGHAHIDHGFPFTPLANEPSPSCETKRMNERCKAIADASIFYQDQSPGVPGWSGPPLSP